jgi:hypothetical protein
VTDPTPAAVVALVRERPRTAWEMLRCWPGRAEELERVLVLLQERGVTRVTPSGIFAAKSTAAFLALAREFDERTAGARAAVGA